MISNTMISVVLVASSMLTPYDPAAEAKKAEQIMALQFDLMKLTYACQKQLGESEYRIAKESSRRMAMRFEPSVYMSKDVTELDRGLKSGKIKPNASTNLSDCENLIEDKKSDIREALDGQQ